jgi:excisionase family DNA binding protein
MEATQTRRTYRVREVVQLTGLSKTTVQRLVKTGDLHAVRVGDCILIPSESLDALLGERHSR